MSLWHVYVGGFTEDIWTYYPRPARDTSEPSKGIERLLFDDLTGSLQRVDSTDGELFSPQYLALHPTLPVLYASEFARPGRLTSFAILRDGQLARQSTVETLGPMAVAVSVRSTGTFAYVGHLGDASIAICPLGPDGAVLGAERLIPNAVPQVETQAGTGLFAYGGSGSKHHQVRATPDGKALVVTDVGCDEVATYAVEADGRLSPQPIDRVAFPAGSAPRHLEFHRSGTIAYVVGEHDGMLHVLEAHDHVPHRILRSHPVVPPDYQRNGLPTELCLHLDGSALFIGVRGPDCIAAFGVDESGLVDALYHEPINGRNPRAVRLDPVGRHLLVGNWQSNSVAVFAIDERRRLRAVGEPVEVHSPSSIVFVAASS
jgi:6-phosphogluconolactonase